MTKGFEDDTELVASGDEQGAMELSDREKAIAKGDDPDKVGVGDAEEEGEESEGKEAESKDDADSGGEGKEASDSDWVTAEIEALADSYGMTEKQLASFDNEADFNRFATLFEKVLAEESETPSAKKKEKKPARKEEAEPEEEAETDDDDLPDTKWFEDNGYDSEVIKIVKHLAKSKGAVKKLSSRVVELEKRLLEGDAQREQEALDRELDSLGGRYGTGGQLTRAQRKARSTLVDAMEVVKQNLDKRGEKASLAVVLKRAELVAFGDEILAEERAKQKASLAQSVKKQAAKRRPVGRNTRPPARRERVGEVKNPAKDIANLPEIVAFWNDAQD